MNRSAVVQPIKAENFMPFAQRVLQRKCACGQHMPGGGQCAACADKEKLKQPLQTKLQIGKANDSYEQEADRVADQVMAITDQSVVSAAAPRIQRLTGQRTGQLDAVAPASVDRVLASPGRPLAPLLRRDMGQRFGYDFSQVRVHTGALPEQSARDVNARAYTVGQDLVFGAGGYEPATRAGQRLIAHELTHVIQQGGAMGSGEKQLLSRQEESPPVPETEDCSGNQTAMLKNHLDDARTWVNAAAPKVVSYAFFNANPRVSAVPANPKQLGMVRGALRDNFHTTRDGVLSIRDGFQELRTALNGSIIFECEGEGCSDQAYVRGAFAPIRRLGDIHVCPPWFNCNDYFRRVTTLIHERAHQYPGATDNGYEWEAKYGTLSVADAIDNAESYAVAARQIYHNGAHGPGMPAC